VESTEVLFELEKLFAFTFEKSDYVARPLSIMNSQMVGNGESSSPNTDNAP